MGYYQRTFGDCLRCAVATCLQMDYETSKSPTTRPTHLPKLEGFARHRGLELRVHPVDEPPDHPWIAVTRPFEHGGEWLQHVYVRNGAEPYFNPWHFRRLDGSLYGAAYAAPEIGFSLHRKVVH